MILKNLSTSESGDIQVMQSGTLLLMLNLLRFKEFV